MENNNQNKCKIGYKVGVSNGNIYGMRFFNLIECCSTFAVLFHGTGNSKIENFNYIDSGEKPGFNLTSRGGLLKLLLLKLGSSSEYEIKFCPFCGAEIRLIEACRVKLVSISKTEHDHYEEEEISRNSEIPLPPVCL